MTDVEPGMYRPAKPLPHDLTIGGDYDPALVEGAASTERGVKCPVARLCVSTAGWANVTEPCCQTVDWRAYWTAVAEWETNYPAPSVSWAPDARPNSPSTADHLIPSQTSVGGVNAAASSAKDGQHDPGTTNVGTSSTAGPSRTCATDGTHLSGAA